MSDGVYCEIELAKKLNKPIRFFQVSGMPFKTNEIKENEIEY